MGCAIAYPQAKHLHAEGVKVDVIVGFRSKDIVILEDEFKQACDNFYLMTDDGTYGEKGFVWPAGCLSPAMRSRCSIGSPGKPSPRRTEPCLDSKNCGKPAAYPR